MTKWKVISSKLAFDHPWFKVRQDTVELPGGKVIDDYFMWQDNDVAQIVPVTEDGKFLLERQYKHAVGEFMLEFPAGYLNDNENPADAANRELLEETGYSGDEVEYIGKLNHNPTKEIGCLYIFTARNVRKVREQKLDVTENIQLELLSSEEIIQKISSGEIWATGTIASFYLTMQKLGYKLSR